MSQGVTADGCPAEHDVITACSVAELNEPPGRPRRRRQRPSLPRHHDRRATQPAWNGYLVTVACPCGVTFERWVKPEDAELDLLHFARLN
jgi:hypothetical protein